MPRQRIALLFVLALAALLPAGASAQAGLAGTWTLNRQASDNIEQAINGAVADMNFITRPIARRRLNRTNAAYNRVVIATGNQVSVTFDQRRAIVTPANGNAIKWEREDGEMFDVATRMNGATLVQTFTAEDGSRENSYTLSNNGNTLTMNVTIRSPRLENPLRYKLVYNRAR